MPYCPKCGEEVPQEGRFCPNCGQDLARAAPAPQARAPSFPEQVMERPTGVTILAALQVLAGLIFCVFGTLMLAVAGLLGLMGVSPGIPAFPLFLGGVFVGVVGGIMLIIGIASFALAYGYMNGRGWAWTLGLVIAVLGSIMGLLSLPQGVVGLLIDALILYYLTRPHVKRFFGKS